MQWDKIQMEMQLVCSIYEKNGLDHFLHTFEMVPYFSSSFSSLISSLQVLGFNKGKSAFFSI